MATKAKARRRKNKDEDSIWPWLVGVGAAVGLGAVAVRVLRGPAPLAAPPPAANGRASLPAPGRGQAGMEALEYDHNGIPTIPLPAESASRTMQARAGRQRAMAMAGIDPAAQGPGGQQEQQESFGGGNEGGSRLGGESF